MIVLVLAVLAFVGFRELTREVPVTEMEAIEWVPVAESAVAEGHPIAVPVLPEKWFVTDIRFEPTAVPTWELAIHTSDNNFMGLSQSDERVDVLIEKYVDENAEEADPVTVTGGDLAGEWETFTDGGGDFAMVHEDENGAVLLYGSASRAEIEKIANTITIGATDAQNP